MTKQRILPILRNERVTAYAQIVLGCLIGALAYPWFLVPNNIAAGGVTGVATILHYAFGWPVGTVSLILNVPLFVIGFRAMGRIFVVRSLIATVLFSVAIDLLPLKPMTDNLLLASVFGGVLLGVGLGLIMRGGATTGGTDMVARMVHHRFSYISVGAFLFFIDFCVIIAAGFTIEVEYSLYALISIYVNAKVIDVVMLGFGSQKACYVISDEYEAIKRETLEKLDRGVTLLDSRGGYSGRQRPVLLVLLSSQEEGQLKQIVRTADPSAFMFVTEAYEVLGEGFQSLSNKG